MTKAKKKVAAKKDPKVDLPETVIVERVVDGDDNYLTTYESLENALWDEEEKVVGVYELKEIVRAKKIINVETEEV